MSLISKFLKTVFGTKTTVSASSKDDDVTRWQPNSNNWKKGMEAKLKDWLIHSIREKVEMVFTWESGNDEGFVTFEDFNEAEADNYYLLDEFITVKLGIPSAGEFNMTGSGTLYIADGFVKVKYSSVLREVTDYDEATETEIYGREEHDKGEDELFAV